jgi:uncharacterized RDD family membrane protein YckC
MEPAVRPDELVVATPERVAFEYTVAGLGSRFMAHAVDVLLLLMVFVVLSVLSIFLGSALGDGNLAVLIWLLVSFLLFVLYFPILEGLWNGQTLGKRLMRIRVLGDRGEPVTVTQVAIRNLIRLVDFLPVLYGVGIITLFVQGGSKRLGDFAAGTVVVRDRERIRLQDLVRAAGPAELAPEPEPAASIWADRQPRGQVGAAAGAAAARAGSSRFRPESPYEIAVRRMPPALHRFVVAYAGRRQQLVEPRRRQLATQVLTPLSDLLPAEVAAYGPLAILDGLASLLYTPPRSPNAPASGLPPAILPPPAPPPPAPSPSAPSPPASV